MATRQSARTRSGVSGSEDGATEPALPQKKRARHRLIGALVLCALAAIIVPLLLESEPSRPLSELPITIPSRDLSLPPRAADAKADTPTDAARAAGPVARGTIEQPPKLAAEAAPVDAKAEPAKAAEAKGADAKASDAKAASDTKGSDAKAAAPKATDGKAGSAADATLRKDEIEKLAESRLKTEKTGRFMLQVGAFAAQSGADAAAARVEALGLRPVTERITTDRGVRIRVRVGPFPTREAADSARQRLKAAGIEAALIAP